MCFLCAVSCGEPPIWGPSGLNVTGVKTDVPQPECDGVRSGWICPVECNDPPEALALCINGTWDAPNCASFDVPPPVLVSHSGMKDPLTETPADWIDRTKQNPIL